MPLLKEILANYAILSVVPVKIPLAIVLIVLILLKPPLIAFSARLTLISMIQPIFVSYAKVNVQPVKTLLKIA